MYYLVTIGMVVKDAVSFTIREVDIARFADVSDATDFCRMRFNQLHEVKVRAKISLLFTKHVPDGVVMDTWFTHPDAGDKFNH